MLFYCDCSWHIQAHHSYPYTTLQCSQHFSNLGAQAMWGEYSEKPSASRGLKTTVTIVPRWSLEAPKHHWPLATPGLLPRQGRSQDLLFSLGAKHMRPKWSKFMCCSQYNGPPHRSLRERSLWLPPVHICCCCCCLAGCLLVIFFLSVTEYVKKKTTIPEVEEEMGAEAEQL